LFFERLGWGSSPIVNVVRDLLNYFYCLFWRCGISEDWYLMHWA
jgi:hypothetical protein